MRKLSIIILALTLLLTSCASISEYLSTGTLSQINSTDFFICDLETGETHTYSKGGDVYVYPASTTKILSILVALETLPADTVITPGDEVNLIGAYSSVAYIKPWHKLTLEMLIEAMLIPSGNDATYVVATACGRAMANDQTIPAKDAVSIFVNRMNEYAIELGCTDTHFTTPDGYAGNEHYSTVSDMALIAKAGLNCDIITKYMGLSKVSVTYASGHTNTWVNTNTQLHTESEYYNEYVCGMKTGSLTENCSLITVYDDGDTRLLIGVFGSPTNEGRYEDTKLLIDVTKSYKEKHD